jgi:hypothetical protein
MNSDFVVRCARDVAELVLREADSIDRQRVSLAYERILGRAPQADEVEDALRLVESCKPPRDERDPELYRWTVLIQAILAGGEFRYVL